MKLHKWILALVPCAATCMAATTQIHYFGHDTVTDKYGVIAPWYTAQNGQFDFRVRIAAETLKRYPWTAVGEAPMEAPEYVYNGRWNDVDYEGRIKPGIQTDWNNGDVGQRNAFVISSLIDYYAYTSDPAALTGITTAANYLVDHCETPANHGWPKILISVPSLGKLYGDCLVGTSDELRPGPLRPGQGKIQLDVVGWVGTEILRAYEMTGNTHWYDAAKHWGDLLAQNRRHDPDSSPWGRYADSVSGNGMNSVQTGGVAIILTFLDELIRTGYTGKNNDIVAARDQGRAYLRDVLLPNWTTYDVWGRDFWDWEAPVQDKHVTERAATYIMDHKDYFPNWKNDVRNILTLLMNHNSASPESRGDVYNGAWAYPESSSCCGRSLWYTTNAIASIFARYSVEAGSEWAREVARRSQIIGTYDIFADGRSDDLIDGGAFVNRNWFKNAAPKGLKDTLRTIGWLPELAAPARENHLVRSSSVVQRINYEKGRISYKTFDAPAGTEDVLRLAFSPTSITADGKPLDENPNPGTNGYTIKKLACGDFIVFVRHDGATNIVIKGDDPQSFAELSQIKFEGNWHNGSGNTQPVRTTNTANAEVIFHFSGNQVRLIGNADPSGGLADLYVDDMKQLVPVDCYSPIPLQREVLYYKNGLDEGPHTLRIVARGAHNPIAKGSNLMVDGIQYSDAPGDNGFGEGGGPTGFQRLIFGFTGRKDYVDSKGNSWRPGEEFVARTGRLTDVVAKTWWTTRQAVFVENTPDEELYRYGVHSNRFTVNLTVGPGTYYVRLKFSENQFHHPRERGMDIYINDKRVVQGFDVLATAGGPETAVDLVFNKIEPENGIIAIRFSGDRTEGQMRDAMVQAIEIGPGDGGTGAIPKTILTAQPEPGGDGAGQ